MAIKGKPRERLISCALQLFDRQGFHATGIDAILAGSKVAKTTLYRQFRSKEELVLAALRQRDRVFRNQVMQPLDKVEAAPATKLSMLCDVYKQYAEETGFSGCLFIKAAAEYPELDSPIHALCIEHKRLLTRDIQALFDKSGAQAVDGNLAPQLMLLLDGATVGTQMTRKTDAFEQIKTAAAKLVRKRNSN